MNQKDYHCSITVNKSPGEAFDCINRVSDWWTGHFKGNSSRLNDAFTVTFGKTFVNFKLTEVVPDKKVIWLVTDCYLDWLKDKTEWLNTKAIFEIVPGKDSVKIEFTHAGLVPEAECYDTCVKGWDFYIKESLYKLITEGKGMPDRK